MASERFAAKREPPDPWQLVWGQPYIDDRTLAAALEHDIRKQPEPPFRTRLLVRDSLRALRSFWGPRTFCRWLAKSPAKEIFDKVLRENLGKPGFHGIRSRLVASPSKEFIEQVFDLLGRSVPERIEVYIAGSIPTLLRGLTYRPTDDVDFVNEIPPQVRRQRRQLQEIRSKYGLTLGHVQSHYLPANWRSRIHFFGDFGGLRVYLVDEYDVFVSKLSSSQEKHLDDLRVMAPKLDKEKLRRRLMEDGKPFLENAHDRPKIEANWLFLYREPLFAEPPSPLRSRSDTREHGAAKARKRASRRKKEPE
jgi:hypothetical protein